MLPTLLALLAAGSLVVGSAVTSSPPLRAWLTGHRLAMLIGFSAGLMLATSLHELLPEALEHGGNNALAGVGAGFILLYTVERLTHFHACRHRACKIDHDDHVHGHVHTHASTTLMGISVHNFIDGLITAAAFRVSIVVGSLVLVALITHQIAVGFSIGAVLLRAGKSWRQVNTAALITGSFIVLGSFVAFIPLTDSAVGFLLGVAGGSFIYISACDLLPEAHDKDEGIFVMCSTLLGYGGALLMRLAFEHSH